MSHFEQAMSFAAVAECGSFTRAALRLGCSKAQISKQVAALEASLGVQLLLRTTRRLRLTEAGLAYLDHCRQAREMLAEGERLVSALKEEVSGVLRVSVPTTLGEHVLLPALLAFANAHPQLRLVVDLSIEHRDLVADGYDFAVRSTVALDEQLIARPLGLGERYLVAAPALLAQLPPIQIPADLRGLPCLSNSHFQDDEAWDFYRDGLRQSVTIVSRMAINHHGALLRAVIAGAGVARLPAHLVAEALADGRLRRILPDYCLTPMPSYLIYLKRRHMPYRNRVFCEFLLAWFAEQEAGRSSGDFRAEDAKNAEVGEGARARAKGAAHSLKPSVYKRYKLNRLD